MMSQIANEPTLRTMVETAGGRWKGIQTIPGRDVCYAVFNEPLHGSTTMLPADGLTHAAIAAKLDEIRARFAAAQRTGH